MSHIQKKTKPVTIVTQQIMFTSLAANDRRKALLSNVDIANVPGLKPSLLCIIDDPAYNILYVQEHDNCSF